MKIQTLNYVAFGPFTEKELDFSATGLHIVYGPNEAGKSSALRGLKALLYGFDARTQDNFLHPNNKLRLRARLSRAGGQELEFIRRKGLKNTLLDSDESVLDPLALAPYLEGVTPAIFSTLFGIDHTALIQGGQAILEQKGEVGQTLFSAALGSPGLHRALLQLDEDASALFKLRGSTQAINKSLKKYKELNKQIKECSLSASAWAAHQKKLAQTVSALDRVLTGLARHRQEINRLQRIQRVAPKLSRRKTLLQKQSSQGDVLVLSADFSQQRLDTSGQLHTAQAVLDQLLPRKDQYQAQLDELKIDQLLLEQADTIEDFHSRLGAYRQGLQDRPALKAKYDHHLNEAKSLLEDVRPDLELKDFSHLNTVLTNRQALTELGSKSAVLEADLEHTQKNCRSLDAEFKSTKIHLDSQAPIQALEALQAAISKARKTGDIDAEIQSEKQTLRKRAAQSDDGLKRLELWQGAWQNLPGLTVPKQESITFFEQAFDTIVKKRQRFVERQQEHEEALSDVSQQLKQVQGVGNIPSEQALIEIRAHRDEIWHLLRRQWLDGVDVSAQTGAMGIDGELSDVFEGQIKESDDLSDRLRRESDRVHTLSTLQIRQSALQEKLSELALSRAVLDKEHVQIEAQWVERWSGAGIAPRTPREMRAWLNDMEKLRLRVETVHETRQRLRNLRKLRKQHIRALLGQQTALKKQVKKPKLLEPLLNSCERLAQGIERSNRLREGLALKLNELDHKVRLAKDERNTANRALSAWQGQWTKLVTKTGMQKALTPAQVDEFIEKVRAIKQKRYEAKQVKINLAVVEHEMDALGHDVRGLTKNMKPEVAKLAVVDAVIQLYARLSENRERQIQFRDLKHNLNQIEQQINQSRSLILTMNAQLGVLREEAQCRDDRELEAVEMASHAYVALKNELDSVEREILELGEGAGLSDLEDQLKGVDIDKLPAKIEALQNDIDAIEQERTGLTEAKGREEKELELMNGEDQAALLADRAQSELAEIRTHSEHYIRLKLASKILRDEIERHRSEHQGPLIKRASAHFKMLTLGSFAGLMSDFDAKDEAILLGVRPNGDKVLIEGMSAGTRDQLYLSLRLASLEKYIDRAESVPFIVDDILIDFDDQRSVAALEALCHFSDKTQVIMFTHHRHIVEQAKQLSGMTHIHAL